MINFKRFVGEGEQELPVGSIEEREKELLNVLDALPEPVAIYSLIDRHEPSIFHCTFANKASRREFGMDPEIKHPTEEVFPLGFVAQSEFYMEQMLDKNRPISYNDRLLVPGRVFRWTMTPIYDRDKRPIQVLVMGHDVTDEMNKIEEADYQATRDQATGLPNRSWFMSRLAQALDNPDQSVDTGVFMLELANYKDLADELGCQAADSALTVLAQSATEPLSFGDSVARFSDDRLSIVRASVDHADEMLTLADKLVSSTGSSIKLQDQWFHPEVNIGLAVITGKLSADELVRNAISSLAEAKRVKAAEFETVSS